MRYPGCRPTSSGIADTGAGERSEADDRRAFLPVANVSRPPGRDTVLPTGMVCSGAIFEKHCDLARQVVGLQHLHFHDPRHVANALAAASGATTKELMYRMGHASPAAALRHQHVTRDRDAVIAAALGEVMTGQPAPVTPLRVPGATASRRQVR